LPSVSVARTRSASRPRAATDAGLIPEGPVRLWLGGEWREVLQLEFDVHSEPSSQHQPRVERWAEQAGMALRERDSARAERLLKQALQLEPDASDLLNNLAVAYEQQGRRDESLAISEQLFARHPDYLFGRLAMANISIRRGELERARELLQPILTRRRFHRSEFSALANAQMELLLAEGQPESAESWLELLREADPDNPFIETWDLRLAVERLARRSPRKKTTPPAPRP
jgi:tetratricopeptide (TPR) repeat protein